MDNQRDQEIYRFKDVRVLKRLKDTPDDRFHQIYNGYYYYEKYDDLLCTEIIPPTIVGYHDEYYTETCYYKIIIPGLYKKIFSGMLFVCADNSFLKINNQYREKIKDWNFKLKKNGQPNLSKYMYYISRDGLKKSEYRRLKEQADIERDNLERSQLLYDEVISFERMHKEAVKTLSVDPSPYSIYLNCSLGVSNSIISGAADIVSNGSVELFDYFNSIKDKGSIMSNPSFNDFINRLTTDYDDASKLIGYHSLDEYIRKINGYKHEKLNHDQIIVYEKAQNIDKKKQSEEFLNKIRSGQENEQAKDILNNEEINAETLQLQLKPKRKKWWQI